MEHLDKTEKNIPATVRFADETRSALARIVADLDGVISPQELSVRVTIARLVSLAIADLAARTESNPKRTMDSLVRAVLKKDHTKRCVNREESNVTEINR